MKHFYKNQSIQNQLKKWGSILFLMGFTLLVNAQYTLTEADLEIDDQGYITSCSYDFLEKDIVIPASIDGQAVIGIEDNSSSYGGVFASKGITSITFPDGFKSIGGFSFYNNELTSLTVPEGVEYIGKSAFQSNAIVTISLPTTLKIIESSAFYVNDIASINLPEGLKKIMPNAFYVNDFTTVTLPSTLELIGSYGLGSRIDKVILPVPAGASYNQWADSEGNTFSTGEEIDFGSNTEYWAVINYTLTNDDVTVEDGKITACTTDMDGLYITIPDVLDGQTITGIEGGTYNVIDYKQEGPFVEKGLRSVILPSTLTQIENYTFFTNNISSVFIPSGVTSIGQAAFDENNITTVEFEDDCQLVFITWNAFNSNAGLSFALPEVAIAGFSGWLDSNGHLYQAGDDIGSLQVNYAAKIPYTLTSDDVVVENGIIQSTSYDTKHRFITIPDELDGQTIIGIKALSTNGIFSHKGIWELTLPTTLEELCFSAFAQNNLKSIDLLRCENLQTIDEYAFYSNSLTSLVLPSTVTSLGYNSFAYNDLTSVTYEENSQLNLIGSYAFSANTWDLEVAFPSPVKEGYNFLHWINWNDDTFGGGTNIPNFQREYEAVFALVPTNLNTSPDYQVEIVFYDNQLLITSPESMKVDVFTFSGQLIHKTTVTSGQQSINFTPFAKGTYIIKATDLNGTTYTEKIIKQ